MTRHLDFRGTVLGAAGCLLLATAPAGAAPSAVWTWFAVDAVPETAYDAAGPGEEPVVICRIRHRRDVEVGQLTDGLCLIGGDGIARPYSGFEILQDRGPAQWGPASADGLNVNADRGPAVHVCRMTVDGRTHVGMVRDGLCSAGQLPDELTSDTYQVLTAPAQ